MIEKQDYIRESFMEDLWDIWFKELHKGCVGLTAKIKNILYSAQSKMQRIDVFENEVLGKILMLYGSIMITEMDEFIYHEMIIHTPMNVHPDPRRVLVIGGGDGCSLREILKHKSVEEAVQVEIDEEVIEVSKRFFSDVNENSFDNPKVKVVIDDGMHFIENNREKFDIIISDVSDPIGPAEVLFQKSFHEQIKNNLTDDGIFVAQSESPIFNKGTIKKMYRNLKGIFPIVRMYLAYIPTYPSGMWSFAFCSKKYDPIADFRKDYFENSGIKTKYYNSEVHVSSFGLPVFVKELVM